MSNVHLTKSSYRISIWYPGLIAISLN